MVEQYGNYVSFTSDVQSESDPVAKEAKSILEDALVIAMSELGFKDYKVEFIFKASDMIPREYDKQEIAALRENDIDVKEGDTYIPPSTYGWRATVNG